MTSWRRRALWGSAGLLLAIVGAAGWLDWTATQARGELVAARDELPALRSAVVTGDGSAARRLQHVRAHADAADDLTHDPVWAIASAVPGLGTPAATTQGLTSAVRQIADTGMPALAQAADLVHPAQLLSGGGRLDVAGLAAAQPALERASGTLLTERDAVTRLDGSWLSGVSDARTQLLDQLNSLSATASEATGAAGLVPPLLGLGGPRRYFVAFQNPAEARGTGGLLDAYAIVLADHGKVSIERTGANTQLPAFTGEITGASQEYDARYAPTGGTSMWLNANMSPNFPDAAVAWEQMWFKATGQRLDGAVALDPRALAAALTATGPVTAPVIGTVDAARIESLVLHDQYVLPQLAAQRKTLMLGVGSAVIDALLKGHVSAKVLVPSMQDAARQGHVLVFSGVPGEERQLVADGVSGAVDDSARPFAQAVVVNAGGNKLDSWLGSSLDYRVEQCTPTTRSVAVRVTLRNDAPTHGLPQYVTVRSDQPGFPVVSGENRIELQVMLTKGATVVGATLDGAVLPPEPADGQLPASLPDGSATTFLHPTQVGGRPAYWLDLELKPGASRTMVLHLTEPPSTQAPLLPIQPLVITPKATAETSECPAGSRAAA